MTRRVRPIGSLLVAYCIFSAIFLSAVCYSIRRRASRSIPGAAHAPRGVRSAHRYDTIQFICSLEIGLCACSGTSSARAGPAGDNQARLVWGHAMSHRSLVQTPLGISGDDPKDMRRGISATVREERWTLARDMFA